MFTVLGFTAAASVEVSAVLGPGLLLCWRRECFCTENIAQTKTLMEPFLFKVNGGGKGMCCILVTSLVVGS